MVQQACPTLCKGKELAAFGADQRWYAVVFITIGPLFEYNYRLLGQTAEAKRNEQYDACNSHGVKIAEGTTLRIIIVFCDGGYSSVPVSMILLKNIKKPSTF